MAGIMDEYDPATPVSKMYCAKLNSGEYEDQASLCTEDALAELIQYLEKNPASYRRVMSSRKKQEEENAGFFSYAKVKLFSLLSGKDHTMVSEEECSEELNRVTVDMVKAYDYSEESKGRRRSKRLAARRLQGNNTPLLNRIKPTTRNHSLSTPPAPPPPPPPPISTRFTPLVDSTLSRRPLGTRQVKTGKVCVHSEPRPSTTNNPFKQVLREINCPERKMMLRSTVQRSPGGTPCTGWPKTKGDSNLCFFNAKMADKFKNIKSPGPSPLATPGTFDSPVSPDSVSKLN